MKEELEILTHDHPTANGRTPQIGDCEYQLRFPMEDGRELVIRMGQNGLDTVTNLLMDMLSNAPSHGDGSTNLVT